MQQALLAIGLGAVALAVAWLIQRRQNVPVQTATGYPVPVNLDRGDFGASDASWLVAVFTSATCSTCAGVWSKAEQLACADVAVEQIEHGARRELHDRYEIEAVPMVLVADRAGDVVASFLGAVTAADLWATLAELREPGSVPDGCDHHGSAS